MKKTIRINSYLFSGFLVMSVLSGCVSVSKTEVTRPAVTTNTKEVTAQVQAPVAVSALNSAGSNLPTAPDRAEILSTIDMFFEALATKDADVMTDLLSADARSVVVSPEDEGEPVRSSRMADLVARMRAGALPKIEEPYWSPIVLQRAGLAVVWAPYEVWGDGVLAHCGIDVFTLTRHNINGNQAWKIQSVDYTREPSACEELWPNGRSVLRPQMFNNPN